MTNAQSPQPKFIPADLFDNPQSVDSWIWSRIHELESREIPPAAIAAALGPRAAELMRAAGYDLDNVETHP